MIIARSPLRISLGGGGTDLPSYFSKYEGFLVAAAIDKYVYISLSRRFVEGIFIKYSKLENCKHVSQINHPIIRETLNLLCKDEKSLEINSMADIPSGTGLGSSGSFTTALIKALTVYKNKVLTQREVADLACKIEIEILNEPIGKQDQYISAFGGISAFEFKRDGIINVKPLILSQKTLFDLEDNLLLFFTGYNRSASAILYDQNIKSQQNNKEMINNLHQIKEIGLKSKESLESGNLENFGELMHRHWLEKKNRSKSMSNDQINYWYEIAIKNGAIGGKLVGAGGGGFLMFYANDRTKLRDAMNSLGLIEVRFRFDFEGSKVVLSS